MIALALWASWSEAAPPSSSAKTCECVVNVPAAAPDSRGTPQSPLIVSATPPAKSAADQSNESADRRARTSADERSLEIAIATTLILLLQLFVFGIQAKRLRETVTTMEITARRQLRAYVFIDSVRITPVSVGAAPMVKVSFKNFGQTPAYNVMATGRVALVPSFGEAPALTGDSAFNMGTQGPGAVATSSASLDPALTAEQGSKITDGSLTLFAYGLLQYTDAFKKQRFLRYRLRLVRGASEREPFMATCDEGNEADAAD